MKDFSNGQIAKSVDSGAPGEVEAVPPLTQADPLATDNEGPGKLKEEKKVEKKKADETKQPIKKGVKNESSESHMDFTGGMDVPGK